MPYQVLIAELAFQETDPANPMVPVGDPEIVTRGGMVPEYVTTHLVNALSNAGVIVPVAEADPRLIPLIDEPVLPRSADQPPVLPGQPVAPPLLVGSDGTLEDFGSTAPVADPAEPTAPVADPADTNPVKPSTRASKDVWETYAVSIGVPQAVAESLSRAELQAKVTRVEHGEDPATVPAE